MTVSSAPRPGDTLADRYVLVRLLGEGGVGVVWEGRQLTTDKAVAIKLLKAGESADAARFLREAKIVSHLSHGNIVQVYDFWDRTETSPAFMVMELLVGESLAARIERTGALSPEETATLIGPVIRALGAAHAAGIVHRDLKPENIFLARVQGEAEVVVKVLDFGIAKPTTPELTAPAMTQTGTVIGTPSYMSPEQIYAERDVDARSDIWSLGVVLHVCLAGQLPFSGTTFGQIFRDITLRKVVSVRAVAPGVPASFDALVTRMLSHERCERPTLSEVAGVLGGGPLPASFAPPGATTQRMPSLPPAGSRGRLRGRRGVLVGAFAACVLVGALVAAATMNGRRREDPSAAPTARAEGTAVASASTSPIAIPVVSVDALPTVPTAAGSSTRTTRPRRPGKPSTSATSSAAPDPEAGDPLGKGRY